MIEFSEIAVPEEYLNILRQQTDLAILVKNCTYESYIYTYDAVSCIEMNEAYEVQKWIPGSLVFGDEGGGRALFYATGAEGFGVYTTGYGALDIEEAVYLSKSLESLLVHADGIDIMRREFFDE